MTRLRLILASLTFSAACAGTGRHVAVPDAGPTIVENQPAKQTQIDRAALRAKLADRRKAAIANFLAYRDARVYPMNQLPGGGFRHVWIDDFGNLCAAATLISHDWGRDPTIRVGMENLEIKIADVKSGPVLDWMLTSGLTRAELVAIQVPGFEYMEPRRDDEINRLFVIYQDVERQLNSLAEANLELATDELIKHPSLARQLLDGKVAGPGKYADPPVG